MPKSIETKPVNIAKLRGKALFEHLKEIVRQACRLRSANYADPAPSNYEKQRNRKNAESLIVSCFKHVNRLSKKNQEILMDDWVCEKYGTWVWHRNIATKTHQSHELYCTWRKEFTAPIRIKELTHKIRHPEEYIEEKLSELILGYGSHKITIQFLKKWVPQHQLSNQMLTHVLVAVEAGTLRHTEASRFFLSYTKYCSMLVKRAAENNGSPVNGRMENVVFLIDDLLRFADPKDRDILSRTLVRIAETTKPFRKVPSTH